MEFKSLSTDLFLSGLDAYVSNKGGSGTPIYPLKQGSTVYYFFSNPWDVEADASDWLLYREVAAFDGLRGGFDMPNGLKEFPINDTLEVDVEGEKKFRRLSWKNSDPLLPLVAPSSRYPTDDGGPTRSWKLAINVIDSDGNHIILKLANKRAFSLLEKLNDARAMNDGFSCVGNAWQITTTGSGFDSGVSIKPLKDEPPVDLPEPYNIGEIMSGIRDQVEAYVETLRGGAAQQQEDDFAAEDAIADAFEAAAVQAESELDSRTKYAEMTDARLKVLLSKAGVTVPPRSTRPALIELAVANNA